MEKTIHPSSTIIPIVDLSPLMEGEDKSCRKKVMDTISEAIDDSGFGVFLIDNSGVSLQQCEKLLKLTEKFFGYSKEEKIKSTEEDHEISGAGYNWVQANEFHDFEYLQMYTPGIPYNGVPDIDPDYRKTFEEVFEYFVKTCQILEEILNECLGLPSNFLKNYNNDRSWDYMFPMHYTQAKKPEDIGIGRHTDPNEISLVLQEDVCGLEVYKDGAWIPIPPMKGKLVVIVSDITQVLSNKKVRHGIHRALKNSNSDRLAIDFVYSFGPNKWVEPLVDFSTEIGDKPKYRGFVYKDYIDLVMKDSIDISYYEI